jgi:hypothetical protein
MRCIGISAAIAFIRLGAPAMGFAPQAGTPQGFAAHLARPDAVDVSA